VETFCRQICCFAARTLQGLIPQRQEIKDKLSATAVLNAADWPGKVNAEAADIIPEKPGFEYLESESSCRKF
jgi:hypothetical protein